MRSVTVVEFVLGGLQPGYIEPEADWTVAFHTPLAETIYDKLTGLLEKRAMADRNEGFTSVTTEKSDILIGRHENALILASSKKRLDAAVAGLSAAPAEGLAKTARFRRTVEEPAGSILIYCALSRLIRVFLEGIAIPVSPTARTMAMQLGLGKLDASYRESAEEDGRLVVTGGGPLPAFEILSAKPGPPDLLRKLPVDTTLAFAWHGSPAELWAQGSEFLLDRDRCVIAPFVEERIQSLQQAAGIKLSELAQALAPGIVIGYTPTGSRLLIWRPNGLGWFAMGRVAADGDGIEMLRKIVGVAASRTGVSVATETAGDWTLLIPEGDSSLAAAFQGDRFILGEINAVRRVRAAFDSEEPDLGRRPAVKALREGSAHGWVHDSFEFRRDLSAGLAFSIDISPDRVSIAAERGVAEGIRQLPVLLFIASSVAYGESARFETEEVPPAEPPTPEPGQGK
jgi:hypothetical protein